MVKYYKILFYALFGCLFGLIHTKGKDLLPLEKNLTSPNGTLQVYKQPDFFETDVNGKQIPSGVKLFIRRTNTNSGTLLLENNRWAAATWLGKTNMLLVENHNDGHSSEIYIFDFDVDREGTVTRHIKFRSPDNGYDIKWFFVSWVEKNSSVVLRKDQVLHEKDSDGKTDFSYNLGQKSDYLTFDMNQSKKQM